MASGRAGARRVAGKVGEVMASWDGGTTVGRIDQEEGASFSTRIVLETTRIVLRS